jgi:predicted kinase
MSGYPGAGKSTLAATLAAKLGFALISKDAILIAIFDAMKLADEEPERAGTAAWAVFWQLARSAPAAVLDTNIKAANTAELERVRALDADIVEVRCIVPPELAMQRYATRAATGHPAQRFRQLTPERLAEYAAPIGAGALLTVDTARVVDIDTLVQEINRRFSEMRA